MEKLITDTVDNGTIDNVHISPIGSFNGSDIEGNAVNENITTESLQKLADELNAGDDILCDIDHQSCKPGVDKDSRAAGWFRKFIVDPVKGLFAQLNLTKKGKELLENREYRYVSPTFVLDRNGKPMKLHSISLTNVPAFKGYIRPIINSESEAKPFSEINIEETDMTKEDLKNIVKEALAELKAEKEAAEKAEEKAEEVIEEKTETIDACAKNECAKTDATTNECAKTDEVVKNETETVKEEDEVCENTDTKKEDEVIKIEALNSAPTPTLNSEPEWKKLSGQAFFDWCNKHPNGI